MKGWQSLLAGLAFLAMLVILALFVLLPDDGPFGGGDDEVALSTSSEPPAPVFGSADLRGPIDCVRGPFRVRVTGAEITRVAFSVNGRRRGTVDAADGGSAASLRVDPAGQSTAAHRVTAKVSFTKASKEPVQTLRLAYQRCSRTAGRTPRFTG